MMMDNYGNSNVTVNKKELLEAVRQNRETHEADYKEARAGYEKKFLEEAQALLSRVKEGKFDKNGINLIAPVCHTKEYDRAIRMFEMSTANEIVISEGKFSQLVLDEWDWKRDFTINSAFYKGVR